MNPSDVALAAEYAEIYRSRGLNPLPSRPDAKRPLCRFADWWEEPAPADIFDRFPTTNIQVMTGRRWRLLVIDLDGPEAQAEWAKFGRAPRTWITHSGGGGRHLWFRLPAEYPAPLPKAFLWKGDGEHSAIERLCDKSLVMAPPSIHPKTGERYRFLDRNHSPLRIGVPAECPTWVLRLKPIDLAPTVPVVPVRVHPPAPRQPRPTFSLDRERILDSIPDKVGLVRSWGVRVAGRPSPKGWVPVHAIGRDDTNPSAAVHQESGSYVDLGSGLRLSLFDLGVQMGVYHDWRDAASDLEARYGRP